MINTSHPNYDSIDIPSKQKESNLSRNVVLTLITIALTCATGYFLYSGFFLVDTGAVSRARLSTEPIIIEYDANEAMADMRPGTPEWTKFHNKLMRDAGYNADELRSNPDVQVSFIAYDNEDDEEVIDAENVGDGIDNVRDSIEKSITCFTAYSETGPNTNSGICTPTKRLKNPIRTGCTAYADANNMLDDGVELSGVYPDGTNRCESSSPTDRVMARCCGPIRNTEFARSDWTVTTVEQTIDADGCVSAECAHKQKLMGCSSFQSDFGGPVGGVQNMGNMCTGQRYSTDGDLSTYAFCADQPENDRHKLRCQSVQATESVQSEYAMVVSFITCPGKTAMVDCNGFLNGRTSVSECANSTPNDGRYFGEFLYKTAQKVMCIAVGDNEAVRAQATCCSLK